MDPLFSTDLDTFKQSLRLTGLDDTTDSEVLLADAIAEVRLGFNDRLGSTAVATLVAITPGNPPATANELLREKARLAEIMWVKALLTWTLPVLFQETSGQAQELWNEEAPFRNLGHDKLALLRAELMRKAEEYLQFLTGEDTTGTMHMTVMEPDDEPQRMGESIYPTYTEES